MCSSMLGWSRWVCSYLSAVDRSEGNGVDPDTLGAVVDSGCASEALDGGLGAGVGQRASHWSLCLVRGNVDDRAGPGVGEEVPDRGVAPDDRKVQVQADQVRDVRR